MSPSRVCVGTLEQADDDQKGRAARPHCRPCCGDVCPWPCRNRRCFKDIEMHLRHILPAALFVFPLTLAAPAYAADPVFPRASRVGLAVPAGFTPSTRFLGFENAQASALITISELPADAYADIEKGFSDDAALKSRGWTVQVREPLTFKDGKGVFIAGPQEST